MQLLATMQYLYRYNFAYFAPDVNDRVRNVSRCKTCGGIFFPNLLQMKRTWPDMQILAKMKYLHVRVYLLLLPSLQHYGLGMKQKYLQNSILIQV
jgi:hypothetical protein